jgi:preprotein translocase subunit SecE
MEGCMRARGTWMLLFFVVSAMVVAAALNYAFRDLFTWLQINNTPVLGESFRLSTLLAGSIALIMAVFFGVFYKKSRQYIDQCLIEFSKVAFPEWKETKMATFTVVIVSLIASVILGIFDMTFSWLTSHNLFIW